MVAGFALARAFTRDRRLYRPSVRAIAIAAAVLLGLGLRLTAAGGDLWLDEIWSLDLVERARGVSDIFFGVPHANNHYLNSVWLWLVGRDAPPLLTRSVAVGLGSLSVVAAAAAAARAGRIAAPLAAAFFATSYFFVHYGSEARGYAGVILCILVAKAAMDLLVDDCPPAAAWWAFGASIMVGGFFHVTMAASAAALACAASMELFEKGRLRRCALIVGMSALACAPALAVFAVNASAPEFKTGNIYPFSFDALAEGLGGAARATLGLSARMSDESALIAAIALTIFCLAALPRSRRFFPIAAIFVIPAFYLVTRAPVQAYPRFHVITAVGLLLLMSEAVAALLERGGAGSRALAGAIIAYYGVAQTQTLVNFYRESRGRYLDALHYMVKDAAVTYVADGWTMETRRVARHVARQAHFDLTEIQSEQLCEKSPDWMIRSTFVHDQEIPESLRVISTPSGACARAFVFSRRFPAWGLSGVNWWIYRPAD
jgi:hypothetical protein